MKKVIGGKIYNTETAEEIASWQTGDKNNADTEEWCVETLFQTKSGQFFLHGEMLKDEMWLWPYEREINYDYDMNKRPKRGPDIILLDKDGILLWLQDRKINPDCIAEFFPLEEG